MQAGGYWLSLCHNFLTTSIIAPPHKGNDACQWSTTYLPEHCCYACAQLKGMILHHHNDKMMRRKNLVWAGKQKHKSTKAIIIIIIVFTCEQTNQFQFAVTLRETLWELGGRGVSLSASMSQRAKENVQSLREATSKILGWKQTGTRLYSSNTMQYPY